MRTLRRAWYYVRSFFRRPWTFADYPVIVRDQRPIGGTPKPQDVRKGYVPMFSAQIDGMFLSGEGDTAEEAREQLRHRFEEFRVDNPLPRPGTQQPLRFAATDRIEAHGALRDEFLERVLHMGSNIFVSDESSLGNFPDDVDEYKRRIMLLYRVDVDELPDQKLVTILDAIARR